MANLSQDWPVYLLLGLVVWFFAYVIINGRKQERIDREIHNIKKDKAQENKK